jgi:hypothetical protein
MVSREIDRNDSGKKRILAVGEIFVLYNDFLNNWVLAGLEEQGYKVFYGPMSEALWLMWRDWDLQQGGKESLKPVLHQFRDQITEVSRCFSSGGHFEKDPRLLVSLADQNLGYYAGAFGRYRSAKTVGDHEGIDGIITVSSMYENTGISLNILEREWGKKRKTPLLNFTFDGNGKDSDRSRIESFLYYLK